MKSEYFPLLMVLLFHEPQDSYQANYKYKIDIFSDQFVDRVYFMKKLMSIGLILFLVSTAFVAGAQQPPRAQGADVIQNDPPGQEDPIPEELYLPFPALDGNPFDHFLLPGFFL